MNIDFVSTHILKGRVFSHEKMLKRIELFKEKLFSIKIDASKVKGLSSAAIHGYRTKGNVPRGDSLETWGTQYGLRLDWLLWGEEPMLYNDDQAFGETGKILDMKERIRELKYTVELQKKLLAE